MTGHLCRCYACDASFPSGERQHEGHFARRFGDKRFPELRYPHGSSYVWLNGLPQLGLAVEICAGPHGYIVAASKPAHLCPCGSGQPCADLSSGDVQIAVVCPESPFT